MFPNKYEIALSEYVRKFVGDDRFAKHGEVLERLGRMMVTDGDFSSLMNLVVDVYESAYLRAVEDYRKDFEEVGFTVEVGEEIR